MKKELYTLLGFLLFSLGFISIVMNIVGVDLAFLVWMNSFGDLFSFLLKVMMIIGGIIVVVLGRTDWEKENN